VSAGTAHRLRVVGAAGHRIAFATSEESADLDDGWPYLHDALVSVGMTPSVVFWDDPVIRWDSYDVVVSVFAWGYVTRRAAFLAWVDRVMTLTHLVNPAPVLRWNSDKTYLADLAADGIPTVPTQWVPPGASWEPPSADYVIKPSVASGGMGAARFRTLAVDDAVLHVQGLHDDGHTAMVQPYQPTIDSAGETDLVYIGGRYSHAIRKGALLRADVGVTPRLWEHQVITPVGPSHEQRAVADTVMRSIDLRFGPTGYARVDLVDGTDGRPLVLELELVEPSLFLRHRLDAAHDLAGYLRGLTRSGGRADGLSGSTRSG
jgi:glutathione synthase/RimK-type ligase-like ATP-grasp enzyme